MTAKSAGMDTFWFPSRVPDVSKLSSSLSSGELNSGASFKLGIDWRKTITTVKQAKLMKTPANVLHVGNVLLLI